MVSLAIMIRKVSPSDGPRIAEIHCYGWRFAYKEILEEHYLYTQISVPKRLQNFLDSKEYNHPHFYVYEEGGIIRGFIKSGKCRDNDKKNSFEIWGIYVEPLMQRKGIGRKLLEHCEKSAAELGFTENVLWVLKENYQARKFYENHGYVPDRTEKYIDKIKATEIRYVKQLR